MEVRTYTEIEPCRLSILVATMPSRIEVFQTLWAELSRQSAIRNYDFCSIEVLFDRSMDYNVGVKRNKLLHRAKGEYIVYIDDDDTIHPEYINLVLEACKSKNDCIGINGTMTTNGHSLQQWFISKDYQCWYMVNYIYYRTPNHISPVKRELALQAGFPETSFGEDAEYSRRLLPLLKTETIISEPLYHYDYWQNK